MTIEDLQTQAAIEMNSMGHVSKGIRIEVCNHAINGEEFNMTVSTDDAILIIANIRRRGFSGIAKQKKLGPNMVQLTFNDKN